MGFPPEYESKTGQRPADSGDPAGTGSPSSSAAGQDNTRRVVSKRWGRWWLALYYSRRAYGWGVLRDPDALFLDAGRVGVTLMREGERCEL